MQRLSDFFWVATGMILIAGVGIGDYLTGYEASFSLFYLIPIALLAWFAGKRFGIAASVISAFVWFLAEYTAGQYYSRPIIYFWNSTVRFGFFIIVTLLLATISKMLARERELSSMDYLTGAVNGRQFSNILQNEIDRFTRYKHPFTLVFFDLDNFKAINDLHGHSVGDRVLITVGNLSKALLRKTDTIARLGGDEFAVLLPETDQIAASTVISRVLVSLSDKMNEEHWSVTFSLGVLTFVDAPNSSDEAIKLADELMYTVKNNGKNAIKFSEYKDGH